MSEHLSPDEAAYHHRLIETKKAADAAWASWAGHLSVKYELGPADGIDEHGQITRAEQPTAD